MSSKEQAVAEIVAEMKSLPEDADWVALSDRVRLLAGIEKARADVRAGPRLHHRADQSRPPRMAEKVAWSATAREDLREIAAYIATDRPSIAEDYCLQLIELGQKAGDFPRIGRVVPELEDENVREIIKHPYRIIYELFPNQPRPVILRVWHGARGRPEITHRPSP